MFEDKVNKISKYFLLATIGLTLLSVLGAVGVVARRYFYGGKASSGQPVVSVPTIVPTAAPRVGQISNWKTYTNSRYKFEIRYPEDFLFEGKTADDNQTIALVGILFEEKYLGATFNYPFISIRIIKTQLLPRDWLEKNSTREDPFTATGNYSYYGVKDENTVVIGETSLFTFASFTVSMYTKHAIASGKDCLIDISSTGTGIGQILDDTYYQILSTFKFLDLEETGVDSSKPQMLPQPLQKVSIPTDWKTYNEVLWGVHAGIRLSFRYPSTYTVYDSDQETPIIFLLKEGDKQYSSYSLGITNMSAPLSSPKSEDYKSGSRRVWIKNYFKKIHPELDFSGLQFEEINFDNGKSYLKISNWPNSPTFTTNDNEGYYKNLYFGVQNGIPLFISNPKFLGKEEILRFLYSLDIRK